MAHLGGAGAVLGLHGGAQKSGSAAPAPAPHEEPLARSPAKVLCGTLCGTLCGMKSFVLYFVNKALTPNFYMMFIYHICLGDLSSFN